MAIVFEVIRWRNLFSTGSQFTEVKLNQSPSTLIVGENGAGKSTILDAFCFALFGKPYRKINRPQLVNSINQKNLLVEVEFSIGTKHYKIARGIKPQLFEIYLNGELINQDAASRDYQKYLEEHVLKLNYKSFTQIVILGSASFTPFMQLPAGHKREVIEDLLDIKIFSVMNEVLKQKYTDVKDSITSIDNTITLDRQKINLQQEYIKTLEEDKVKKTETANETIEQSNKKLAQLEEQGKALKAGLESLQAKITDEAEIKQKYIDMVQLYNRFTERIKEQNRDIAFYDEHDVCPTCSQDLAAEVKQTHKTKHTLKKDELERACTSLEKQIQKAKVRIDEIATIQQEISEVKDSIIDLNTAVIAEQNYVQKLLQDLQKDTQETGNIDEEKKKLKALAKDFVKLSENKSKLVEEKHYLDVAGILLKDTGIKTRVIRQYLPVINKLVNKYLQAMNMFVMFELDEEFNEKIKSRNRDEFSYASFSEGEKARIDLAILFTWRAIAKMKNSASTNLLLLDEVFDGSLDMNGTDFVMNILNTVGDGTNTFIISHKDALFDKFNNVIRFEIRNNFSTIVQ